VLLAKAVADEDDRTQTQLLTEPTLMPQIKVASCACILAGGVLLFIAGRAASFSLSTMQAPRAELTPTHIDLGQVQLESPADASLLLRNVGNERLLIIEIKTSCHCTVAELPTRVIEPGGSLKLKVTLKATRVGARQQQVILRTNDPAHEIISVNVTAQAVAPHTPI
jgi:hypothetical protein